LRYETSAVCVDQCQHLWNSALMNSDKHSSSENFGVSVYTCASYQVLQSTYDFRFRLPQSYRVEAKCPLTHFETGHRSSLSAGWGSQVCRLTGATPTGVQYHRGSCLQEGLILPQYPVLCRSALSRQFLLRRSHLSGRRIGSMTQHAYP
jgi:hypothetical protein